MEKFLQVVKPFEMLLFDNYGVITFAKGMSPAVLDTMKALRESGKEIVILSNASYGSEDAEKKYAKKGMIKGVHYAKVMTSGQFAYDLVQKGELEVPGPKMYVFGTANFKRPEDKLPDMFKGSVYSVTENIDEADFVYCGIPQIEYEDRIAVEDFIPELKKCLDRELTMVCANPDLRANEGGRFVVGQGLIVRVYGDLGVKP